MTENTLTMIDNLTDQRDDAIREAEELRVQLLAAQRSNDELRAQRVQLEVDLAEAREQRNHVSHQLETATADYRKVRSALTEAEESRDAHRQRIAQLTAELWTAYATRAEEAQVDVDLARSQLDTMIKRRDRARRLEQQATR